MIHSDLHDALINHLTVPLATPEFKGNVPAALCPVISVKGELDHALMHCAGPLLAKALCRPVDAAAVHASAPITAMDVELSGV